MTFQATVCTLALLAFAGSACSGCEEAGGATALADSPGAASAMDAASVAPVEVVVVARHPFERRIEVSANVLPARNVGIVPQVPGRILTMAVDVGDRVEQGQVLVRLDPRDYLLGVRQARATLDAAKAQSSLASIAAGSAESSKRRMEKLGESDAVARSDLEKVDDGYRMGLAQQSAADAQVQLADVGLAAAQTKLADTMIRAPFAGVVLDRGFDEGAMASPMSERPLLVLAEDRRMYVEGSLGELELASVRQGLEAAVVVDALAGETFRGEVELVSPMVDPRTRTASVRVVLDNPDGRLGAGMSARIAFELGAEQVVAVPADALVRLHSGERAEAFVVEGGVVRRREVTTGGRRGELVEVVDGLEPGDAVVRAGRGRLRDGDRVVVGSERARGQEE